VAKFGLPRRTPGGGSCTSQLQKGRLYWVFVVPAKGLEPPTSRLQVGNYTLLYAPIPSHSDPKSLKVKKLASLFALVLSHAIPWNGVPSCCLASWRDDPRRHPSRQRPEDLVGWAQGFWLRLSQGGSKTFIVMIGSGKRFTIGRYPAVTLADARTEAKRILAEKQLGKLRPARVSFDQALKEYLADCEERLRPRSLKNYRDYLTSYFHYSRRSLCDITTREIILALKSLSPGQREQAVRIGKTFFTWCVRHSLLDQSPMQNMPPVPLGKPRTRVLSESELRAVWRVARAGTIPFHVIVALLLLTGQRRGEIAALQWDWIKDDRIEFPASVAKNDRAWTVPLGPEAQNLLGRINKMASSPFVFPALRKRSERTTTMNGWSKAKAAFDRECGVSAWTMHDLRRTFATNLQRLGMRLEVTEQLLNHVSGTRSGIVGVYQRYQYLTEMRDAILAFERWISRT
jgi:integrase